MDVMSPFGLVLAVGTQRNLLWAYSPSEQARFEGEASPTNLARFLGAPVSVGDLVDILMGLPPARVASRPPTLERAPDARWLVTLPIEDAVVGVEGVKHVTSLSREQVSQVTVEFELGRDVDLAANDMRDRVARIQRSLPDEVDPPIVAKLEAEGKIDRLVRAARYKKDPAVAAEARRALTGFLDKVIQRRLGKQVVGFTSALTDREEARFLGQEGAALLQHVEPEDLLRFGLIPEFIGRLPVVTVLGALDEDELLRILTEPRNAVTRQYERLFEMQNVKLTFTPGALRALARLAVKRGSGARGLRAILEAVMVDVMFEIPSRKDIGECIIDENVVSNHRPPEFRKPRRRRSHAGGENVA
jgi:hypothetical protein